MDIKHYRSIQWLSIVSALIFSISNPSSTLADEDGVRPSARLQAQIEEEIRLGKENIVKMLTPAAPHDLSHEGDPEKPIRVAEGNSSLAGAAPTHSPLLHDQCRARAVEHGIDNMRKMKKLDERKAVREATKHLESETRKLRQGQVTYREFLVHMGNCGLCNPIMLQIAGCHVDEVAQRHPEILLFRANETGIEDIPIGHSNYDNPNRLHHFVKRFEEELLEDSSKRILLVGRASRTRTDLLKYNVGLSKKRAETARNALIQEGVADSRIQVLYLGYEEPQIYPGIAEAYGIQRLYQEAQSVTINQSVVMVIF